METGLYGQQERGDYLRARATEQRWADVDSEGTHEGITTEAQYRQLMAECICQEIRAARKEQECVDLYDAMGYEERNSFVGDVMWRAIGMSESQQTQALAAMGKLAARMEADGFHITRVYYAISAATPIALNLMREERMKRHPDADRPEIRLRAGAQAYGPAVIEKYGDKYAGKHANTKYARKARAAARRAELANQQEREKAE